MTRKLAVLLLGGVLVASAACSSTNSSSTTTTAAPATSAPATSAPKTSDTKAAGKTTVTKPATIEKIDKSKLPSKAQAAPKDLSLTQDESDCIDYTIYKVYTDDPSTGTDDATVAGIAGGAIAVCVDQGKIAEGVTAAIKSGGANLTDTQLTCIKNEIASTDQESLAIFLGVLITQDNDLMKPFQEALSKACNIS